MIIPIYRVQCQKTVLKDYLYLFSRECAALDLIS